MRQRNDRLAAWFEDNQANHSAQERAKAAQQLAIKQVETNFFLAEAYLGPGAVLGSAMGKGIPAAPELRLLRADQAVVANTASFQEAIHHAGGNAIKAMREYEPLKYISRFAAELQAAVNLARQLKLKAQLPESVVNHLRYLEHLGLYVYGTHRRAHDEGNNQITEKEYDDRRMGSPVYSDPELGLPTTGKVDDDFLAQQHAMYNHAVAAGLPFLKEVRAELEARLAQPPRSTTANVRSQD